jgi:hypothetical protein
VSEYLTMKEIGCFFGVTSHAIGKKLKEIGLRTREGKPSGAAFAGGFCAQHWTRDMAHYSWAWHQGKTVGVLEKIGLTRQE